MDESIPPPSVDRTQLQRIIAGRNEGVILIDPDQTVAWANKRALAMHGVAKSAKVGKNVSYYRGQFALTYCNNHSLPLAIIRWTGCSVGEAFSEVVAEVSRPDEERQWVHKIRTLVLRDVGRLPDCNVLVIEDETERGSAGRWTLE